MDVSSIWGMYITEVFNAFFEWEISRTLTHVCQKCVDWWYPTNHIDLFIIFLLSSTSIAKVELTINKWLFEDLHQMRVLKPAIMLFIMEIRSPLLGFRYKPTLTPSTECGELREQFASAFNTAKEIRVRAREEVDTYLIHILTGKYCPQNAMIVRVSNQF